MNAQIVDPRLHGAIVDAHLAANGAWLLVSCALAMFAVFGLALFHGGLARVHHILSVLTQSLICVGVGTVLWVLVGYTIAFGPADNGIWGGLGAFALRHLGDPVTAPYTAEGGGTPTVVVLTFHLMLALIAATLVTGATAGRLRLGALAVLVTLWLALVYAPVAHWVWSPHGWLFRLGALDFAGGTTIHASAGAAGVVLAAVLGPPPGWRRLWRGRRRLAADAADAATARPAAPRRRLGVSSGLPHNVPLALVGAGIVWVGWFGVTAGSALGSGQLAGWAFLNTQLAAAAAMTCWVLVEWFRDGLPTPVGAASGAIAGLVAITPASGFVSPLGALAIGALGGVACALTTALTGRAGIDDVFDVGAVHLVGGVLGTLLVGVFATADTGGSINEGLVYGGSWGLLGRQALAVVSTVGYSAAVTLVLALAVRKAVAGPGERQGNPGGQVGRALAAVRTRRSERSLVARFKSILRPSRNDGEGKSTETDRSWRKEDANWFTLSGDDGSVAAVNSVKIPERTQA
ncbi:ammonium transporter [Pseudofrankia saprophytica]|uniref:ammonium transporter n=1 Tax=Pseudofrankia saprophytica TaxID=298655 RepID=UPI0002D35832|nr:ammonium transporter [Pseudofrankia saprophytica]